VIATLGWQMTCVVLCLIAFWAVLSHAASSDVLMAEHSARVTAESTVVALQGTVVALRPTLRPCLNTYSTGRC
jgi:hypothetical protein